MLLNAILEPSPQLHLPHPIRLDNNFITPVHLLTSNIIPHTSHIPIQPTLFLCPGPIPPHPRPLIQAEDLQPSDMRILPILMVLNDPHLQHHAPHLGLPLHPAPLERDLLPPSGFGPGPFAKLDEPVPAGPAAPEFYLCGRVGFVEGEVEVDAQTGDFDEFEEVQGEQVRLGAVGLPEGVRVGRDEGVGAAGRLVGGDGPGG